VKWKLCKTSRGDRVRECDSKMILQNEMKTYFYEHCKENCISSVSIMVFKAVNQIELRVEENKLWKGKYYTGCVAHWSAACLLA
jgi:hypothetical protein